MFYRLIASARATQSRRGDAAIGHAGGMKANCRWLRSDATTPPVSQAETGRIPRGWQRRHISGTAGNYLWETGCASARNNNGPAAWVAGIPTGCCAFFAPTGGVASLNHRQMASMPPASEPSFAATLPTSARYREHVHIKSGRPPSKTDANHPMSLNTYPHLGSASLPLRSPTPPAPRPF